MSNTVLLSCEKEILNEFDSKYSSSTSLSSESRLFVVANVNKTEEKIVSLYISYPDEKHKVPLRDLCNDSFSFRKVPHLSCALI